MEEENKKYFHLDRSIEKSKERINNLRKIFYSYTMHTRTETSAAGKMYSRGFKAEIEVIRLVDCLMEIEKHIEKNLKKQRYLTDYLNTLPLNEQIYLLDRYEKGLLIPLRESVEIALNDEIHEIEEAIFFMYGYNPEPKHISEIKDFETNFINILEALGIE